MSTPDERRTNGDLSLRNVFRLDNRRGQAALASMVLFLTSPVLGVFVSRWFFLLLLPAFLLSIAGFAGHQRGAASGRMGALGVVMAFNGVALMISLFVVGFVDDFLLSGHNDHETSSVAVGYTTVHIMLGVGLMLYDNYRHRAG